MSVQGTLLDRLVRVADIPVVKGVESFDNFYRREYWAVLGLAIVLCGNRSTAEELTQDAFLMAFKAWDQVGRYENPGAWVRRVVSNRSVSRYRRAVTEAKALIGMRHAVDTADPTTEVDGAVDVWREVRKLPRRQLHVIALTYLSDMARRDVAEILGCSEQTVKTHLRRGRETLERRLGASWEASDGH